MTPTDTITAHIAVSRELAEKATKGPWYHRQSGEANKSGPLDWIASAPRGESHGKIILGRQLLYGGPPDYAFIAASRTLLPQYVEALAVAVESNNDLSGALCALIFVAGAERPPMSDIKAREEWQTLYLSAVDRAKDALTRIASILS